MSMESLDIERPGPGGEDLDPTRGSSAKSKRPHSHCSTLLTDISDAVLHLDDHCVIRQINGAASRITGYSRGELKGTPLDVLLGTDRAEALCNFARTPNHRVRPIEQMIVRRKDGGESIVQVVARLLLDPHGAEVLRLVLKDISVERRLQDELQVSLQERRQAHEIERLRLSRKLHEDVLQDLLAVAINLESLSQTSADKSTAGRASEMAEQTREIADNLRSVSHALRPRILDRMTLVSALRTIVHESCTNSLKSRIKVRGRMVEMPWYVESGIYRLVLELLSNVRKHSGASEVTTTLIFRKADAVLTVEDNGVGFTLEPDLSLLISRGKHGIVGMYERVQYLGGTIGINSSPETGTRVRIVVPYDSTHARNYSRKVWPNVPDYLPPLPKGSA